MLNKHTYSYLFIITHRNELYLNETQPFKSRRFTDISQTFPFPFSWDYSTQERKKKETKNPYLITRH